MHLCRRLSARFIELANNLGPKAVRCQLRFELGGVITIDSSKRRGKAIIYLFSTSSLHEDQDDIFHCKSFVATSLHYPDHSDFAIFITAFSLPPLFSTPAAMITVAPIDRPRWLCWRRAASQGSRGTQAHRTMSRVIACARNSVSTVLSSPATVMSTILIQNVLNNYG